MFHLRIQPEKCSGVSLKVTIKTFYNWWFGFAFNSSTVSLNKWTFAGITRKAQCATVPDTLIWAGCRLLFFHFYASVKIYFQLAVSKFVRISAKHGLWQIFPVCFGEKAWLETVCLHGQLRQGFLGLLPESALVVKMEQILIWEIKFKWKKKITFYKLLW